MRYDPEKYHRRSIRLQGYDYAQAGAYFVTICIHNRECLLGEIVNGEMHLNEHGKLVEQTWFDLPHHVDGVILDAFVIMPNHVHGIIVIMDTPPIGAGSQPALVQPISTQPTPSRSTVSTQPIPTPSNPVGAGSQPAQHQHAPPQPSTVPKRQSLPEIVRQFKTYSARRINALRGTMGIPVWQRNYYEHIIRNDSALEHIRQYIWTNPQRWDMDRENPYRTGDDDFDRWLASLAVKLQREQQR